MLFIRRRATQVYPLPSDLAQPSHPKPLNKTTNMAKYKLEYIWLDGYTPVPNLRSKTQVKEFDSFPTLEELPHVGLRRQLDPAGRRPQLRLHAQARRRLPGQHPQQRRPRDVRGHDARRRHPAPVQHPRHHPRRSRRMVRLRAGILPLSRTARPLGFPADGFPGPQGEYYCGVGYKAVGDIAREIVEEHLDLCLDAGINHEGINAEVAKGQWEFQIFGKGSKKAADEIWVARYILNRLCEKYGVDVEYHCKPIKRRLERLRHARQLLHRLPARKGRQGLLRSAHGSFAENMEEHIAVYGPDNHLRLTGLHETQSIDKFTYGVADRGASIRIPHSFVERRLQGLPRRPPSELPGRSLSDRLADSQDHRRSADDLSRLTEIGPIPVKAASPHGEAALFLEGRQLMDNARRAGAITYCRPEPRAAA